MSITIPVIFLAALSLLLALVLVIANRRFWVYEDPRIDTVTDLLPGANCGACGQPGCRAFAEVVVAGKAQPSLCTVGGAETAEEVANFLGIDPGSSVRKVARLHCAGGKDVTRQDALYAGYESCRGAALVAGGPKSCRWGCIGLGDCEIACTFGAISMMPNGLPFVNAAKCTACNDCVEICPKELFTLMPLNQQLLVQCKSELEGDDVLEACKVGCTGCSRCAADAPEGLITMKNNLPVINTDMLDQETELATLRCPTNSIVWINGQQFPEKVRQTTGEES